LKRREEEDASCNREMHGYNLLSFLSFFLRCVYGRGSRNRAT
jgi:hypothetical protein